MIDLKLLGHVRREKILSGENDTDWNYAHRNLKTYINNGADTGVFAKCRAVGCVLLDPDGCYSGFNPATCKHAVRAK